MEARLDMRIREIWNVFDQRFPIFFFFCSRTPFNSEK